MKCAVCNAEATAGASFCPHCGAKLPVMAGDEGATPAGEAIAAAPAQTPVVAAGRGRVADVPEEVLWEGSYSPKAMLGTFVALIGASIVLVALAIGTHNQWYWIIPLGIVVVLWIFALGRLSAARLGVHYKLTNQMFYHQRGVLTRITDRIELIEIHDVTYEQGLFDRMVDVGRIKISSNDRTDPIFYLRGVEQVSEVARMIDQARRGEQVRRGRRIESLGVHDA
jgi:membrane protein YdbS with pleckstrin-like domain